MFVLRNRHAICFYLSKSQLKNVFACEIAITNYYDISNYYDVDIIFQNERIVDELVEKFIEN